METDVGVATLARFLREAEICHRSIEGDAIDGRRATGMHPLADRIAPHEPATEQRPDRHIRDVAGELMAVPELSAFKEHPNQASSFL